MADPVETVKNVLSQMSGKTDAVIVLTYTGSEDITNALAAIDGVSIVIESGASEAFANTADNGTVITSAGTKGNVIGVASLDINRSDVSVDSQFYTSSDYSSLSAEQSVADAVARDVYKRQAQERAVAVLENRCEIKMQHFYMIICSHSFCSFYFFCMSLSVSNGKSDHIVTAIFIYSKSETGCTVNAAAG